MPGDEIYLSETRKMLVDCNSLSEVRAARAQKSQNSHQNGTFNCLRSYGARAAEFRVHQLLCPKSLPGATDIDGLRTTCADR